MPPILKSCFKILSSLQLTLVLLVLSLILVFVGTMAQEPLGLYIAQSHFFQSMFVDGASMMAALKKSAQLCGIYLTPMQADEVLRATWVPVFPGGYLLGALLLINLLAAHIQRFHFTPKKSGILLTHFGLIILLLGQLFTERLARESGMRLREGESKNYSEADRRSELAIMDVTDGDKDRVVSVPESWLARGGVIAHESLPFQLNVKSYYQHSTIAEREGAGASKPSPASIGVGTNYTVAGLPKVTDMNFRDVPSAIVEVSGKDGALGTWLVSGYFERRPPQAFTYQGRTYQLSLRLERKYYPFSLTLLDFRHDKYKGTEIPRNFSSQVRIQHPEKKEDREVLIYMNNPLRYEGLTFYQASFDKVDDKVTILQVVRNPSWLTPYIACALVCAGLLIQFMIHLVGFLKKRTAA